MITSGMQTNCPKLSPTASASGVNEVHREQMTGERDKMIAYQAERIRLLEDAIRKMWPVVTKHTDVAFWGPIENEIRRRR